MTSAEARPDQILIKAEPGTLIWSEPLSEGGRAVVKMYRRRPLFDPVRHLVTPYRVEREHDLLAHLHRNAIPCAEPLWWSHGRNHGHGRYEILATREIAGTAPLAQLLRASAGTTVWDLAPLFQLARRMHEAGVSHGAYYPTNILAASPLQNPPALHLIDLAHGCRFSNSIVGTRPAEFDILDMIRAIERRHPITNCEQWIAGYGLDAPGIERLMRRLERHRIEKPWRHLHRTETDTRAAWDRLTRPAASRASAAKPQIQRHTQPR
jgi:hypothetical protein